METKTIFFLELLQIGGELHTIRMGIDREYDADTAISMAIDGVLAAVKRGDDGAGLLATFLLISAKHIERDYPGIAAVAERAAKHWDK